MPRTVQATSFTDFAEQAMAVTPKAVRDFVEGGSGAELSLRANRAALDAVHLVPRVLRDVSAPVTSTTLPGTEAVLPVAVAPMAYHRLLHDDGELASARAAAATGVPFTVPMLSSVPLETLAVAGGPLWFQLYWLRDRGLFTELVDRAEAVGCRAVVLSVDVPRMARRPRDIRNSFALPPGVHAANLPVETADAAHRRRPGISSVARHTELLFDPSLNWSDLEWLRTRTRLPVILKGVLHPDDARRAADLGVAAVIVSNHGGRQFDGAVPSITAVPAVRDAVPDSCAVLMDSGIRSGLDVLKALAHGASGVLLGRPVLWGLAAAGEAGVRRVLSVLHEELVTAMILAGCPDLVAARQLVVAEGGPWVTAAADPESGQ